MHLNISQLNKKVQKRGPESQFQMISAAKPIEAGNSLHIPTFCKLGI